MKTIIKFTCIDLELNQPSNKIIQIGACSGNIETGFIEDTFSIFVNPNEQLNPFIIDLTGIKQEQVDNGTSLLKAYNQLAAFHLKNNSFINPITWGGGDSQEILNQLNLEAPGQFKWVFGRRWIDAKTLFVSWRFANNQPIQSGLARSMTKLGLKFEGRKHNALDDSINTFKIYCALLKKLRK